MAKTYTSTLPIKVRKQHTCAGCGGVFSYIFERKITGTGNTAERATAMARKNADKALVNEVDQHPCPTCGLYQPEMIGQAHLKKHKVAFWLSLILLVVFVIVKAADGVNANIMAWVIAGTCAVAALWHAAIDKANPNSDIERNRQLALDRVSSSALVQAAQGRTSTPADELVSPPKSMMHRLAIPLLFASVLLAAVPELVRLGRHWPVNSMCYPPVVGPGDTTKFYLTSTITSVKGFWRGTPTVQLAPDGGRGINVSSTTNSSDWGTTITAKSSEKSNTSHPWVKMTLPDNAALASKSAHCEVALDIEYPQMAGSSNFETVHATLHEAADLQLAPAHAGAQYDSLWWEGIGFAALLVLVCGRVLMSASKALQAKAIPTKLLDV